MKIGNFVSRLALLGLGYGILPLGAQVPVASPASIALSTPAFSTTAVTQALSVTGAPEQSWRVQAIGGFWLRFIVTPTCPGSVNDCTTFNTGTTSITILADPTGLPAFLYTGSINISYPGGAISIPVSLNVGGSSSASPLTATPTSLTLSAAPSGSIQSANLSIAGSAVSFTASSNASWLTTNLGGSTVSAPSSVTVTANPAGLVAGAYQGALTFTPTGGGTAISVPVTLNISVAQQLVVNPTAVAFSTASGLNPVSVSIGVASGPQVPFTATISYPGLAALGWLTINAASGQTGTNLILSATGAPNLAAGSYAATVTISSPGLTPVAIPVTLNTSGNNSGSPRFVVDVSPIALNVQPFSVVSRTFNVSTSTGAAIPYNVTSTYTSPQNPAVNWLSLTFASGTTPAAVTVSASPGSLPPGTYTANLFVSSTTAGFTALNIPVSMTVSTAQVVTYSPTSLIFTYANGGAIVSTQNILVGLTPSSPALQASVTVVPDVAGQSWLSALLSSSTAGTITPGAQLSVSANAAGLANGTYTGRVQISTPFASNPLIQIPVIFTVSGVASGGGPAVAFSPTQLSFTSSLNGPAADQSLSVTTNGVSVPYSLSANVPWITVLNGNGNTPSTATVRVVPSGLPAGTYTGIVILNAPGAVNNGAQVTVSLVISSGSGQPLLLNPISLGFVAPLNGTPPLPRSVSVSSTASSVIAYTVTSNQSWLQGIATTDSTPGFINVYVNPAGLSTGTYLGNLTVFSSGFSFNLPVTLEITSGPLLRLSQQSVTFNYQSGLALPSPQTILLNASTGATLATTISAITSSGGNWLVAAPGTVQTPGAFALSLVSNIVSTLAPGTYLGTVTVNAPGATSLGAVVNVTLNVSNSALLTMSTAPVIFNAEVNRNPPPAQTRQVTSTSGVLAIATSVTTNTGAGWLTASVSSGTTPSIVTISVSPAGLSAGVYTGSVTVSSGSSGTLSSNALVIPVTLNVSTLLSLNADKSELIFSGSSSASPQTIQINSTSGNIGFGVSASVSNSTVNWLTATAAAGFTPSSVTVTANPASLGDGTYFGLVTITPLTAGSSPVLIPVTLIVNRGTALQVSPTNLSFTHIRGAALPPLQLVQVSQQPFTFTVQTAGGGNWLNVNQTNNTLQVAINSGVTALATGNYTATITLFQNTSQTGVTVTVNLAVVAQNLLVVSPNAINLSGRLGQGNPPAQTVQVTSLVPGIPLSFNVTSDAPWLSAIPLSGTTPASLTIAVNAAALPSGINIHVGRLTLVPLVGGQTSTITVAFLVEASAAPVITAFANSATFQPGPLSAGMLFTIIGTDLGPAQAVSGNVVNGRFTTALAGVRVLFDGIAAPVLYASSTQINAAVPYQLFGRAFTQMTVEYNGVSSTALAPRIADTAPGIFTIDGTRAAALNQDGTINGPGNAAQAGTVVVLYTTGEGQTSPGGIDGELVPSNNLKKPLATVRVLVNGTDIPAANIFYAGSAPGLVAGLMQINFRLPANTPANLATPVEVFVGSGQSPAGTTIAVRP